MSEHSKTSREDLTSLREVERSSWKSPSPGIELLLLPTASNKSSSNRKAASVSGFLGSSRCRGVVWKTHLAESCPDTDSPMKTYRGGPCIKLSGAAGATSPRQPPPPLPAPPSAAAPRGYQRRRPEPGTGLAGAWHRLCHRPAGAGGTRAARRSGISGGGGAAAREAADPAGNTCGGRRPALPAGPVCGGGGGAGPGRGAGGQLQSRENNYDNIGRFRWVSGRK